MNSHDLNGQQILSLMRLPIPPYSHGITLIRMLAMGHFLNPNILTVCNGAKRVTNSQDHSVVSTVAGELIPRLMLPVRIELTLGKL